MTEDRRSTRLRLWSLRTAGAAALLVPALLSPLAPWFGSGWEAMQDRVNLMGDFLVHTYSPMALMWLSALLLLVSRDILRDWRSARSRACQFIVGYAFVTTVLSAGTLSMMAQSEGSLDFLANRMMDHATARWGDTQALLRSLASGWTLRLLNPVGLFTDAIWPSVVSTSDGGYTAANPSAGPWRNVLEQLCSVVVIAGVGAAFGRAGRRKPSDRDEH